MTKHVEVDSTWTFQSDSVAEGFDKHVREQLPWYETVTDALVQIGRHYIGEEGRVYDIGASNGNVGRALAHLLEERQAHLIALEESQEMVDRYNAPGMVIQIAAEDFNYEPFDLAVAMLALMFVAPDRQRDLLDKLVARVKPGGAIVLVERMLPPAGYLSIVTSRLTLNAKLNAGAAPEEIIEKELSLSGVQRPLDPALLEAYGAVEFFRFGDFAGWIIEHKTTPRIEIKNFSGDTVRTYIDRSQV